MTFLVEHVDDTIAADDIAAYKFRESTSPISVSRGSSKSQGVRRRDQSRYSNAAEGLMVLCWYNQKSVIGNGGLPATCGRFGSRVVD